MKAAGAPERVLLVGPVPPPVGGASVSFRTFMEAWVSAVGPYANLINTSPRYLKTSRKLKGSDIVRGISVAWQLWTKAPKGGAILAFVNIGFFLYYARFLALLQAVRGVPVVLSFFGGGLTDELMRLSPERRKTAVAHLNKLAGVIVETGNLRASLQELGVHNVTQVAGYRRIPDSLPSPRFEHGGELRAVFLSHVRKEKGVMEVLEALSMAAEAGRNIRCDIYGPITADLAGEFEAMCQATPGARYCGTASGNIPEILANYDVLLLPTYYQGEGHPGVVIESMMAGIPVVGSRWRAVPELITAGENGLLVEPRDAGDLADALCHLADHPEARKVMGQNNRNRLTNHDVFRAVERVHQVVARSINKRFPH